MGRLFWLSDKAWAAIEPHLPRGRPDKPRVDDRRIDLGHPAHSEDGRALARRAARDGPPGTIYNRFNRWSRRGIWQRIFEAVAVAGEVPSELNLDSTHFKAHRSAAGGKGGMGPGDRRLARQAHFEDRLLGRSSRPAGRLRVDPGNVADIAMAIPLLETARSPRCLTADKAYDAMRLRNWLKVRRIKAVIPSTATRYKPFPLDRHAYMRRNRIESLFCRLKNWQCTATRYDRLARSYLATLALVFSVIAWT